MKFYIFILCAVIFLSSCGGRNAVLDIEDLNFGWSSEYEPGTHHVVFTDAWSGRGWMFGEDNDSTDALDLSDYDKVVVELSGIRGPVSKVHLITRYADNVETRDLSTIVDGATTLRLKLDEKRKKAVKSIYVMCDTIGEMNVERAYFDKAHLYGDPTILKMSDLGVISGNQFDGFSDNAKVEFTFGTYGDIMGVDDYGKTVDMTGWGVGIICSAADIIGAELPSRTISLQNLGIQTYACELGDLKYLLSLKDDDGECGIYWTVWTIGGITNATVIGTTIAEAID